MTPTPPGGEPLRSPDIAEAVTQSLIVAGDSRRPSRAAVTAPAADDAAPLSPVIGAPRRFWTVVSGHAAVDFYAGVIPALSIALAAALGLNERELTALFVINSVMSGVSQPIFAWLTDKFDTRLCAPVGLALAALALCLIGHAGTFWQLVGLQVIGQVGVGMFHPIGAAITGQLGRGMSFGRSMAVTMFFTAGMVGSVLGPIVVTRMNQAAGMTSLLWLIPPGVLFAWVLHRATSGVAHRHAQSVRRADAEPPEMKRARVGAVRLLFAAAVLRFGVNNALFYLFARWCSIRIQDDPARASSATGTIFALASVGMGVASLAAGRLIRPGDEKRAMVALPVLASPLIALMGLMNPSASWSQWGMWVLAFVTAAGYAATAPLAITLAQRLMPGNTGVASSLMMGGAWTLSSGFPFLALGAISLGERITGNGGLWAGFLLMAFLLAANGALSTFLPDRLLRATAEH